MIATNLDLPRLRPPGYTQGAATQPMQRPMIQPMTQPTDRPDAMRPPQGGPGTAAPPTLAVRPPAPQMPMVTPAQQTMQRPPSIAPMAPAAATPGPARPNIAPIAPPTQAPQLGGNPLNPSGQPVPLGQVGDLIQRQLANPSRFDLSAFKDIFNFGKGELENEANRSRQAATADAARRGVFHSDVPDSMTGGFRDIGERYNRGLGTLTSNLALEAARTGGSDFNSAIGNAFRFMENQQAADQFGANLGLNAAQLGYGGSPDINSILAQIGGTPLPQLGQNPLEAWGSALGTFQRPGAPRPGTPPISPTPGQTPAIPPITFPSQMPRPGSPQWSQF